MKYNQTTSLYQSNLVIVKQLNETTIKVTHHKYPTRKSGYETRKSGYETSVLSNCKSYDYRLSNSLSRARTKIFELSMANNFNFMVTFTLNSQYKDRYDIAGFIRKFGQMVRNRRRRKGDDIQYLLVPEMHKDGAFHMHGLIKGILSNEIYDSGKVDKKGRKVYKWSSYEKNFGFSYLTKVDNQEAVSRYITKYIEKDLANGLDKNKKAYYATRGLKRPKIIKKAVMTKILQSQLPKPRFENEYFAEYTLSNQKYVELVGLFTDIVT